MGLWASVFKRPSCSLIVLQLQPGVRGFLLSGRSLPLYVKISGNIRVFAWTVNIRFVSGRVASVVYKWVNNASPEKCAVVRGTKNVDEVTCRRCFGM